MGSLTAHDVFKKGVNEALQDFNSQREQRFLASSKAVSGRYQSAREGRQNPSLLRKRILSRLELTLQHKASPKK